MSKSVEYEYVIFRLGEDKFEVVKFNIYASDEAPASAIYHVTWNSNTGKGKCDCPAAAYRQTGINDKHVQMVKKWVENGDQFSPKRGGNNGS